MKIIIDCNVLIAAGLKDGVCRAVLEYSIKSHEIYLTEQIMLEYIRIIRRDKFKKYADILEKLLILLSDAAELVEEKDVDFILPDPHDLKYLKASAAINADIIVTGNIKDFPDKQYGKTRILTPREFYDLYITC